MPVSPTDAPWPDIDGIDSAEVSGRWCGNGALYTAMLSRLLDEFRDVESWLDGNDAVSVERHGRRMHKLQGSACILGARTLRAAAKEVECACLSAEGATAVGLTCALADELRSLAKKAASVLSAARVRSEELAPSAIKEFSGLLRRQSVSAIDRFGALAPQLKYRMGPGLFRQLSGHMNDLQFEAALNDLRISGEAD
jgi:HPt (histidine-containing phosphotransfer) domain-containing protein